MMTQTVHTAEARDIMIAFADQTGLSSAKHAPRRYLWTDAFAVCNFLSLYEQTEEEEFLHLALKLVDQVHTILGQYRPDDSRKGWISGLGNTAGKEHPTVGGLRIGKKLNERGPNESFDERLEWDRDGQYFHYLTKWMHALCRTAVHTGDVKYCHWATELAKAAHTAFVYEPRPGAPKRMFWKMSIDLSRPLIPSMGQHDALDGFLTYNEIRLSSLDDSDKAIAADLDVEINEMAVLCEGQSWDTDDPLGLGGLLCDSLRVAQMTVKGGFDAPGLFEKLLGSSNSGVEIYLRQAPLHNPAEYRLAFRELGLSIGLRAVERLLSLLKAAPDYFDKPSVLQAEELMDHVPVSEMIEGFWRNPANQLTRSWRDHCDINAVMLATSLLPDAFLTL